MVPEITGPRAKVRRRFCLLYTLVGLHVPNCELFGGRSSYKESVSRLRIYFPRASLAQGCTANAVVEALGKDAHTNGWWAADSLRSAFRSMRVLMFSIS